jgi:1,2-diacylglycerol 3-beta-glucosyltransferase
MNPWLSALLLLPPALWTALPAVGDLLAALAPRRGTPLPPLQRGDAPPRLLFLVPAHDEELLIDRCVRSLLDQDYPRDRFTAAVIADNCTDQTAARARAIGATVLERQDPTARGKHHAIGWALKQVELADYAAVIVIDADAVVNREFARAVASWPGLPERVMHTYDGLTNEFENWLTRLAGLLTRNRYDIALPLKAHAGLSVPFTGDGMVIGTAVLARDGWRVETITEGWELYARYTLQGLQVDYEPRAVFYDQEARTFSQGEAQRQRWAAGRFHVLRLYWRAILRRPGVRMLQRLDLLAELSSFGPVMRALVAIAGMALTLVLLPSFAPVLLALFAAGLAQPALYSLLSLVRHPEPGRTALAFLRLPGYALWRLGVGLRGLLPSGRTAGWVRTARHEEEPRG